jgi:sugar/nucleoside kinase (ribokinase family)
MHQVGHLNKLPNKPQPGLSIFRKGSVQIKKAFILLNPHFPISIQDIRNSIYLCQSIATKPTLLHNLNVNLHNEIQELANSGQINLNLEEGLGNSSILSTLDAIPLDEEVLLVSTGSTELINNYCQERLKSERRNNLRWNILSSDYARYALLDRQKSLSDFIPADTEQWLKSLLLRYGDRVILSSIASLGNIETLIIGESIIDEYIYCDALGKVSKDPLVAFLKKEKVSQAGGVLAAAKHFAGLGSVTTLLSEVGPTEMPWVVEDLTVSGIASFELESEFASIVKTRYVDRASNVRVFETYSLPSNYSSNEFERRLDVLLKSRDFSKSNFVVMDYGHDLFNSRIISKLLNSPLNLSINAQSNAGNRGFNTIARYRGAKSVFLNGSEVQLETRNKLSDLIDVVPGFAQNLNFNEAYVTNGSRGIICWSALDGQFVAPAFAPTIVDRTGAGDATLAVISAMRAAGIPREIAAFYGNVAGGLLVGALGNEVSITSEMLLGEASKILRKAT